VERRRREAKSERARSDMVERWKRGER